MARAIIWILAFAVPFALDASTSIAGQPAPPAKAAPQKLAAPPAAAPAAKATFTAPLQGTAVIEVLRPVVKVKGKEVVTTLTIKNVSYGAIGGLRIDEYWYDKAGNILPGDSRRLPKLLQPDEIATIDLHTPKDPRMNRNAYQFSHVGGRVRADMVKKFQ